VRSARDVSRQRLFERELNIIQAELAVERGVFGFFWPPMHLRPVLAAGPNPNH